MVNVGTLLNDSIVCLLSATFQVTGITLLPTLGKLFTTVLTTRLTKRAEDYVI